MTHRAGTLTLSDIARENGRRYVQRIAFVDGDERLTYLEFDHRVERLAAGLRFRGIGLGDRVLWMGQNRTHAFELLFAASRVGAVLCPVNWRLTPQELAFILDDAEAALVVWQAEEIGPELLKARALATTSCPWINIEAEYESLLSESEASDSVSSSAAVLMIYTAAYLGRPAAALLSSDALLAMSTAHATTKQIDGEFVYLNSGPMHHIGNFSYALPTFLTGGTNVLIRRVDPEVMCRLIDQERCVGAYLAGPTAERMAEANADGRYDLLSLRSGSLNAAWDAMVTVDEKRFGRHGSRGYGQTEVAGLVTSPLSGSPIGPQGWTTPLVRLRIVNEAGIEVPDGEVGEIEVRGPVVMNGYHRRAEVNAERFRHAGWYSTNDLGRREPDGSLTFIGARSRLIKSGSENIYATEVERALLSHEAVQDCCVIPAPDPQWTQVVLAVVVLRPDEAITGDDLAEHCRQRLAPYKKPRRFEFVDTLPRTDGSVDVDELVRRYASPSESKMR